ncbi:xylose isomerase [Clostridium thermopalmarium]|jgi:xylose isomerase|uniref:Xylose isomerase n=1 Tax=Clostridium thermopalmarium DSM 5974 TaxID=1121340 RepID=A0A2T0ANM3_9CLOT|nr:xylose isomerase [Clostridium thermopalmarium]MBE6044243.1 xylose isomerase [Clostridium thermopalmarium]PRR70566.1 Xylose isomerase [Clostridium thermopalmarium DSM 5974]PVZ21704.1 xylose isomerase [Clostridium thermopalmarium DSM 5974]
MSKYFNNVPEIKYEGKDSKNPFAFKYYNPDEVVGNKTMKEHLRFTMSYWHTLTGEGTDPFGAGTMERPWDGETDKMKLAKMRMEAAFEFMDKLGIEYFAFHDRDIAPEGKDLAETNKNLDEIVAYCKELMKKHNKKLLWGTANMFSNPRFVHGAATSNNADVFAYAAAQVKKALEVTKELGGENYVFWGGREGYETLLNTDMKLEQDNLARFFHMAVDYAKKIGFTGQFLIEPKPKEPTKHQYDFDVATVLSFLKKYDLDKYFKVNIEANHATLAGHTVQHELAVARINGVLGSLDINQGDLLLGWDTDQFPTNIYDATLTMYEVLKNGGIAPGGLNFDAKVRRGSFEVEDLFLGYIAGMDTFAKALKVAHKLLESRELEKFVEERYSSFREGIGKDIVEGKVDFEALEKYALNNSVIKNKSGRQELLESILNQYILNE